jgi:hypothetical protein
MVKQKILKDWHVELEESIKENDKVLRALNIGSRKQSI